jgi:hypothetical protein
MRDINSIPGVTVLSTYYVPVKYKLNTIVFFISMALFSAILVLYTLFSNTNLPEFMAAYIVILVFEILISFLLARLTGKVLSVRTEYIVTIDNEDALTELIQYYDIVESSGDRHIVVRRW